MKLSVAGVILVVSLVRLGVCCSDDDISELKEQISVLGAKLDTLINNQLKCQTLSEDEQEKEASARPEEEEQSTETEQSTASTRQTELPIQNLEQKTNSTQNLPLTITEVWREAVGESLAFTVKYGSNKTAIITRWEIQSGNRVEGTDTALSNGEYETSILMSASEVPSLTTEEKIFGGSYLATVHLNTDNYGEEISLYLYNGEDAVETEIPLPIFEVDPDGDLVYEEGEDVLFKVQIQPHIRGFMWYITYFDPDTGNVVRDFASNHVDRIDSDEINGEFSNRINTSESRISGLLSMESQDLIRYSSPNKMIANYIKEIIVRPASQTGPFPDGYLGFVKTASGLSHQYGHNITACRVGHTCRMDCIVAGSDITQVKLVTVEKLGNLHILETLDPEKYEIEEITKPYLTQKVVRFHENSVPEEPDVLRCTAQNAEGKTIVMETAIIVVIPVEIIEEKSGFEMMEDQDDEDVKNFRIFCTVRGDPQPMVKISSDYLSGSSLDDEVFDTGNNTYTVVRYVSYSVSEIKDGWHYLLADCLAYTEEPFWDSDHLYIQFDVSLIQP